MGRIVIAVYRPKPGQEAALMAAVSDHLKILRQEGLVTDREPTVMRAEDGTVLEVFEWVSDAAVEAAHANPAVGALWARFEVACNYVRLADLHESQAPFATFDAVDPG